jgi:hypothetical protein
VKNKFSGAEDLATKIAELELQQIQQLDDLKMSVTQLGESLKPSTIIRNAMKTVVSTPGLRSTAIDTAISAGAGLLGKKLLFRNSGNIFKRLAGTAVQFIVTNFVRNKMPSVKKNYSHNGNGIHKESENTSQFY